jgi:hypothetical protein
VKALERRKIWSWVPTGPETKIVCAGEAQQKFNPPTDREVGGNRILRSFVIYTPPNFIKIIKLRRIRWARNVAHMEYPYKC